MRFYADLHIHSKYSRATSRDCDLENLSYWGQKKGITVIGTGDFTHPAWIQEIKDKLVPAEPGFFKLRSEIEKKVKNRLPPICQSQTRFMLSVEISTIYKKGDKVRKIHHLVYAPSIEKAEAINRKLEKIGNIRSDGRPILGLDSRHLLEIVLDAGEGCFLIPAHIWTPWFSVFGSKSGFDSILECYDDLAGEVFALETGLSSDPEMNWKISQLDRFRLVSNSDAHSPPKLGREANLFETELSYFALKKALETGKGYAGTVEFFPEEGKYHMDGHRNCGVCLHPKESKKHKGLCPKCGKPLTLGVMYRVEELADRHTCEKPKGAAGFKSLVPLPEIISEISQCGVASQKVTQNYENILNGLGNELGILSDLPIEHIQKSGSSLVAEAIRRMRKGEVIRQAGYDGEYGVIKLFKENELKSNEMIGVLFDLPSLQDSEGAEAISAETQSQKLLRRRSASPGNDKQGLRPHSVRLRYDVLKNNLPDSHQQKAIEMVHGPLLIMAGPGTGKTKVLTHRVAHLIQKQGADPASCLTITFTRRAAEEMRKRLSELVPDHFEKIPVMTFHALGLQILKENRVAAGLPRGFQVVEEVVYEKSRNKEGLLRHDDLIRIPSELFEEDPGLVALYQQKFAWVSIDEYQDMDAAQYRFIRHLVPQNGNICVIGDPDQAIYGFRGADVSFFLQFQKDHPKAKMIQLSKSYRSVKSILSASAQMIAPSSLVPDRQIEALLEDNGKVTIHQAASDRAEAQYIVENIEKMIGGTSFLSMDTNRSDGNSDRNYSFSDFAILYRAQGVADTLEDAMRRSGIPYRRFAHTSLSEHADVKPILKKFDSVKKKNTVLKALQDVVEKVPDDNSALKKLFELAEKAGDDSAQFLTEVHLCREFDAWDERADRVSLMTLHASKGLEFPVVFIMGCEDGILPWAWTKKQDKNQTDEERRLFFVGMTRAKRELFLTHAKKRLWRGKLQEQNVSPFLQNIEEKLLERSRDKNRTRKIPPKDLQLKFF